MHNHALPLTGQLKAAIQVWSITHKQVFVHILLWITYILYESSVLLIVDGARINLVEVGLNFCSYAAIFYLNSLWLLPAFLKQQKYFLLVVNLLLLIALLIPIRYFVYLYALPFLGADVLHPFDNHRLFLGQTVWRGGYFAMLSFGYFFANSTIRIEREKRIVAEVKRRREIRLRKLEKELADVKIETLRNQINPHFLYNTLNFFYAQMYPRCETTARGVLLLADIMRYGLEEDEANGKVMLTKEIQHLKNYLDLQQLRFNHQLQVHVEEQGSLAYRMILPMLLITIVENCFKHGDLLDPQHPLVIRIEVQGDELRFSTRNKKKEGAKETSTGIGQANIRRRLDLKCKNRYSLEIIEEQNLYTCQLILKL